MNTDKTQISENLTRGQAIQYLTERAYPLKRVKYLSDDSLQVVYDFEKRKAGVPMTQERSRKIWARHIISSEAKYRNECLISGKHISYMPALSTSLNYLFIEVE